MSKKDADSKRQSAGKTKKEKKSFSQKLAARFQEFKELGSILVSQPREFPAALLKILKRTVRNIWDLRGGGLYACGFAISWLYLEATMLIEDIIGFADLGNALGEQLIRFVFRFTFESLANTIYAFMWPAFVAQYYPPWGAIALGAAFVIFPITLKKPLQEWLFRD